MNIFVANLNFKIQSEYLKEVFEEFGQVDSAKVVIDHATGKSKGFGFVEMPNDNEANKAIQELNGAEVEGKAVVVSVAKPRESSGPRHSGGDRGGHRSGGYNSDRGGYNSDRRSSNRY